jgi:hypothetical protein
MRSLLPSQRQAWQRIPHFEAALLEFELKIRKPSTEVLLQFDGTTGNNEISVIIGTVPGITKSSSNARKLTVIGKAQGYPGHFYLNP